VKTPEISMMMTPSAEASSRWKKRNPSRNVRITSVSVAPAGPPPVITKMAVNERPNAQIVSRRISTSETPRRPGSVIARKLRQRPAPSTLAASYSSCGIDLSPASSITIASGNSFQTCTIVTLNSATFGSVSQPIGAAASPICVTR
jgi:hypothetical protein